MPEVAVRSADGAEVEALALDDGIFGVEVRADLVHAAVVAQLAAKRLGTHQAKTRGQVSGGGRKPYRQKGTGHARHGSRVSPIWRGGGVTFGPKPRDYRQRLPRKVRRRALFSAWSAHVEDGTLVIVEALSPEPVKTRVLAESLQALLEDQAEAVHARTGPPAGRGDDDPRPTRRVRQRRNVMLLMTLEETDLRRAAGNLAELVFDYEDKVTVLFTVRLHTAPYASVYDLTRADVVVATRAAIDRVTAEFSGGGAGEEGDEG